MQLAATSKFFLFLILAVFAFSSLSGVAVDDQGRGFHAPKHSPGIPSRLRPIVESYIKSYKSGKISRAKLEQLISQLQNSFGSTSKKVGEQAARGGNNTPTSMQARSAVERNLANLGNGASQEEVLGNMLDMLDAVDGNSPSQVGEL